MQKLLGANFNVIHANNGQEALDLVLSGDQPPDFVLLDIMMPNVCVRYLICFTYSYSSFAQISGLEVCEKIREKFPMCDLPVILVSARGKPEHIAEVKSCNYATIAKLLQGLSKGANDYIVKPVNKNELLARIRLHISICLSCKMLCEKNHDHEHRDAKLVDMHICEGCKSAPSYPGQKSLLLGRRGSKMQLLRNIAGDPGNVLELTNNLPLMVTLYDVDGAAVTRNKEAAYYFSNMPQNPNFKNNTFLPCMSDRNEANDILSKVLAGT
jgi:CheY-like chemotaxis protein